MIEKTSMLFWYFLLGISLSPAVFAQHMWLVNNDPAGAQHRTYWAPGHSGLQVQIDLDGFADQANAVSLQSNGRILVAGRTHSGSGANSRDAVIARLLPDGSLDNSFGSGGVVRYTTVNSGCFNPEWSFDLQVLDDDRFLAAGYDQRGCDAWDRDFLVVRYQADGTVDQVFSEYPSFHGNRDEAQAVAVQADGKVIAAGWAQSVSGEDATMDVAVARWNPDGTLDTSFDREGEWLLDVNGDMDRIDAVAVQPDGKIVLSGSTTINGQIDWLVIRLHPDGSRDASFGNGGMFTLDFAGFNDGVVDLLLQNDGRILIGGNVSADGLTADAMVVRLNPDGTIDTAFGTGGQVRLDHAGQDNTGSALAWHDGGKILVAGRTFDGTYNHFALTRVLPDGTPDVHFGLDGWHITAFDTSSSIAGAVAAQPDHRIVLAGHTESIAGIDDTRDIALVRYDLLESWWPAEGEARDSVGTNHGIVWDDEGDTFGPGHIGQAFWLDGVNDYIEVPHHLTLDPGAGSFTLMSWVQTSMTGQTQTVASKYECGGFCPSGQANSVIQLFVDVQGYLAVWIRDRDAAFSNGQTLAGGTMVADGQFHHIAVVRDLTEGSLKLYVDGTLDTSVVLDTTADGIIGDEDEEADPFLIGAQKHPDLTTLYQFFVGAIDEVKLYKRALTPEEIAAAGGGVTAVESDWKGVLPESVVQHQNYPNPFEQVTRIEFTLPAASRVRLVVYDLLGREVKTLVSGYRTAGSYVVQWDGTDTDGQLVPGGVYLYRLQVDGYTTVGKMMLLR